MLSSFSGPVNIRVCVWQHPESQSGKNTLDTHYAYLALAHAKYLRFKGDIITPRDMYNATVEYGPTNTAAILANTTHKAVGKFNIPKLGVRQVHVYVYRFDGDVELYHHTGLKKAGMYERLYFNSPSPISDDASNEDKRSFQLAFKNYLKIKNWRDSNTPVVEHGTVLEKEIPVFDMCCSARETK